MPIRLVFMGSPDFALPVLRVLAQSYDVAGVVTQPDRPSGRGRAFKAPAVKSFALELGLPVIQPEKLSESFVLKQLREWNPEIIVVAAFGQILRRDILDLPAYGCINVHASLLPRWRGAAPINAAILAGDEETGVTIMKMDAGLDTGPILARKSIRLARDDTAGSAAEALSRLGAELLIETLPDYISGRLIPRPQPNGGVTLAPMLKKADGRLDFSRPAVELERRVRAMHPWPGAFLDLDGGILKVHRARIESGEASKGRRFVYRGQPAVGTGYGFLILDEVQPAGKNPMSGKAFLASGRKWET
jgi:methionyl-tRNA formyltransferase